VTATQVVHASAQLSEDGVYRYELTRRWGAGDPVRWIMLNPSTADANVNDPTIRRCIGFARTWGYEAIVVHNLFALRATNPRELRTHPDPVGPENDAYLRDPVAAGWLTVCAWGAHGELNSRADRALRAITGGGAVPMCLGRTKAGHPRHPLYLRSDARAEEL
jgi:hypothetical protein